MTSATDIQTKRAKHMLTCDDWDATSTNSIGTLATTAGQCQAEPVGQPMIRYATMCPFRLNYFAIPEPVFTAAQLCVPGSALAHIPYQLPAQGSPFHGTLPETPVGKCPAPRNCNLR